jgi:putative transposase
MHRATTPCRQLRALPVFTPKHRRGPLTGQIPARCQETTRDACAELLEFNGETGHVHLLAHYPPRVALSRLAASRGGPPPAVIKEYTE